MLAPCSFVLLVGIQTGLPMLVSAQTTTERVSVSSAGVEGNAVSFRPSISGDGRYVAFTSAADNLVPGDTNGARDIFIRDRQTGTTERVKANSTAQLVPPLMPSISADGRFVAFRSSASNLVPGDTNGLSDIFVYDRQTGVTERVSVSSGGVEGNGMSLEPTISGDGRYVAFTSGSDNLVPNDENGAGDIFVRDRQMGATERVSLGPGGVEGDESSWMPSISADGCCVAFVSKATNLSPGDTNGTLDDVFVHERQTGVTEIVSVSTGGVNGDWYSWYPSISADGRFVAFESWVDTLVPGDTNDTWDIFVRDRLTGVTERVSVNSSGIEGNSSSIEASISADGRFVAFRSQADNLDPDDTYLANDILIRDRLTGTTRRVNLGPEGVEGNRDSIEPFISADGCYVAYFSEADNLVPADTNGVADVFVSAKQPPCAVFSDGFESGTTTDWSLVVGGSS